MFCLIDGDRSGFENTINIIQGVFFKFKQNNFDIIDIEYCSIVPVQYWSVGYTGPCGRVLSRSSDTLFVKLQRIKSLSISPGGAHGA